MTVHTHTREQVRAWLAEVCRKTGLKPTQLAKRAKVSPTTLTRVMNDPSYPHTLSTTTIAKISAATGLPAAMASSGTKPAGFMEPDAEPYAADPKDKETQATLKALQAERAGVDAWVLNTRALETAGYLPGDIVLVDLNQAPKAGDIVVAQIYDWTKGKAETVMRIYEAPYLVAATFDPALRKPILVDGDRVVIRGVVEASFRRRQAA